MKKKFRILSLFGVTTALLVAMLSSISAFAAPSGAITGTITVDKTWYSNVATANNNVLIKVTDADANTKTATSQVDIQTLRSKATMVSTNVVLTNTPIVGTPIFCDTDAATATLALCVAASKQNTITNTTLGTDSLFSIVVANAAAGVVTLTNISANVTAADGEADFDVYYDYSAVDYVKTTLTSTQEPNGNTIWLKETGKDTGIFSATVDLTVDATPTDFGSLKTIYTGAPGTLAAGVQSAAFNSAVDHLDEKALLSAPGLGGVWCVRTSGSTDHNCADGTADSYFAGALAIVTNTGVVSATPTVKWTPVLAILNAVTIDINYPHDLVTLAIPDDNGLKALNLNTIKAEYSDATPTSGATAVKVSDTASIETTGATFASILPVTATSTQSTQPTISGTVTDTGGSGIDVSTVMINIDTDGGGTLGGGEENLATVVTGADGDNTVTFTYTAVLSVNNPHNFVIEATDMAGNISYTDATPAAVGENAAVGTADAADWHQFTIDSTPATFASAQTGKYWDSSITVPVLVVLPAKSLTAPAAPILITGFLFAAIAVPSSK